jgi:hypothetical protein
MTFCIFTEPSTGCSTVVIVSRASNCGSRKMSAIELIGAIAASCSAKVASTSSVVWRPIQSWMMASSSSACSSLPA